MKTHAHKANRSAAAASERSPAGSDTAVLDPPDYGIDFVDRGLPAAPVQRSGAPDRASGHTGVPEGLKAGIEHLSGVDFSDVRVHYDSAAPARIGALAYAKGGDIHLAPGQEKHLPHEAWHVVQQRQGRVRPTMRVTGQPVNDDPALEHEAEVMGEKATAGPARDAAPPREAGPIHAGDVVQRAVGFEFEVPDWRVKKGMPLTRGLIQWDFFLHKNMHLIDGAGWYLQCDTLGVDGFDPEFVVSHVPDTTAPLVFTATVTPMINLITAMENWNRGEEIPLGQVAGGLNLQQSRAIVDRRGFQFRADPQVNVDIDFNRLGELFADISTAAPAPSAAATELGQGGGYFRTAYQQAQALLPPAGRSGVYTSLVALMAHYIARGRHPGLQYSKQATEIMARTDFGTAYQQTPEHNAAPPLPAATLVADVIAVADAVLGGVNLIGTDLVFETFAMPPDINTWVTGIHGGNDALSSQVNNQVDTSMGALGLGQAGAGGVAAMILELREARTQLPMNQLLPFMLNVLAHVNALHAAAAGAAAPLYGATPGGLGAAPVAPRAQPWRITKRLRTVKASLGY